MRKYYMIIDKKTQKVIAVLFKRDFKNSFYNEYLNKIKNKIYEIKVF